MICGLQTKAGIVISRKEKQKYEQEKIAAWRYSRVAIAGG